MTFEELDALYQRDMGIGVPYPAIGGGGMNKQELLDELNEIMNTYSGEDSFENGVITGLATAIAEIDKLDEPGKVVIPQFVAEWIEECKKRGLGLGQALDYGNLDIMPYEMKEYIKFNFSRLGCGHDKQELVARAWLYGYEVEKEKLYIVQLPTNLEDDLIILDADGDIWKDSWPSRYKMTEKRIKEIDERYWPFAVEVAE